MESIPNAGRFDGKKILLAWNGYQYNITGAIEDYLVSHGAHVTSYLHPLFSGRTDRIIRVRKGTVKTEQIIYRRLRLQPPFCYAFDPFLPFRMPKADLAIGFGCLVTNRFLWAQQRGWIRRVIQWNIDFVPRRFENNLLDKMYKQLDRRGCLHADRHVDLNTRALNARNTLYGLVNDSKGSVVPVGLWKDRIVPPSEDRLKKPTLVFLGNLAPRLGVELFLRTAALVRESIPNLRVEIVGGGEYLATTKELAKSLNITGITTFHGDMHEDEFIEVLGRGCIGFAPYLPDPMSFSNYADPSKVKNYLQASLPIFITDVPHIAADVAEFGGGLIVEPDHVSMAQLATDLISDVPEWLARAEHAQAMALSFDWNVILDEFFDSIDLEL